MVNFLIAHTDRFACAVSERGVAENISDFLLSDIGYSCVPDTYGATPWTDWASLFGNSALRYADKVKAPTLFIHGDSDTLCSPVQSKLMYSALKYFGVPTELLIMKDEPHSFPFDGTPFIRTERLRHMLAWFDRYLKGTKDLKEERDEH
jgi:dipeptidyl aminopeptidase/acylaminoacyl peptidase